MFIYQPGPGFSGIVNQIPLAKLCTHSVMKVEELYQSKKHPYHLPKEESSLQL
jgi:hypothetical protein